MGGIVVCLLILAQKAICSRITSSSIDFNIAFRCPAIRWLTKKHVWRQACGSREDCRKPASFSPAEDFMPSSMLSQCFERAMLLWKS